VSKHPAMSKHPSLPPRGRERDERSNDELAPDEMTAELAPDELTASDGESAAAHDALSPGDRELLAAARGALQRDPVPGPVRQRMFERMLEEVRRPEHVVLPAAPLVPVPGRGAWLVLGSAAAMAFGLVLLANARSWFRSSGNDEPLASDAPLSAEERAARARPEQRLGDRIFQSALFRAPAPAWSGALPPASASLFGEAPFTAQSHGWQVKRWDDLGSAPVDPAKYFFEQGALCVTLRAGDRVIGGYPWLPKGTPASDADSVTAPSPATSAPAPSAAPAPVALTAGHAYRLVFKAWASEPLPAQLLIAVGHSELPFSAAAGARVDVASDPQPFVVNFVAQHDDPSVGVAFLANAGADAAPSRVCLSDVTLTERAR